MTMAADGVPPANGTVVRQMPVGRRFAPGPDPRRNLGKLTAAEQAFKRLVDSRHIPRAAELLEQMFHAGMDGDVKAAELFFKVCGLIRKPTDDAALAEIAAKLLDGMIAEARSRQAGRPLEAQRVEDVGTDE